MAMRRALALSILTVACLAAGSSPASAASASGSLNYATGTTSAGMLDVGMVFSTVAADLPASSRSYTGAFPDDSARDVARVSLQQSPVFDGSPIRKIYTQVPTTSGNIIDVKPAAGVTMLPPPPNPTVAAFSTGGAAWTPGRSYRLRVRQIARPSGGRRFRVSVTNVATGGERVIVDFTRQSLTALSLRTRGDVSATASTCASLFDARASIDRPRGVRGSDGAAIVAGSSPSFLGSKPSDPGGPCVASQRRVSTDRIVIDLGR